MKDELKKLVEGAEARAKNLPRRSADEWEQFVADIVVDKTVVQGMAADVTACVGIESHEAHALAAMPEDIRVLCAALRELDAELNEARAIALRMIRSVAPEVAERNEASSLADRLDLVSAALAGARTRKPTCWCEGLDKPFAGLVGELRFRNNHVVPLGPPHRDGCPKSKRPTEL